MNNTVFLKFFCAACAAEQATSHYLNQCWHKLLTSLDLNEC